MMDDSRGGFLGLGGLGSGGGSGLSKLSPYLNVDPSYLQTETPEYILNQVSAQASKNIGFMQQKHNNRDFLRCYQKSVLPTAV